MLAHGFAPGSPRSTRSPTSTTTPPRTSRGDRDGRARRAREVVRRAVAGVPGRASLRATLRVSRGWSGVSSSGLPDVDGRRCGEALPMITIDSLTKRYGGFTAVDDVTFTAEAGRVTGFLGPNGAGKSTTMRVMVGLTPPTSGTARINGQLFADLPNPGLEVGVLLDASAQHAGRTGREILTIAARTMGLPRSAGRGDARPGQPHREGGRPPGAQLLARACASGSASPHALLGDPSVLILDEPANGLDPAGIRWMRDLLRSYADQGGTVLLSSHLLHEIEVIADDIVVIGNGRIVAQGTKNDLLAAAGTVVRSAAPTTLAHALELAGIASTPRARRRRPHPGGRRPGRPGRPGRRRRPHRAPPRRRRRPGGDVPRAHRRDTTRRSSGMSTMTIERRDRSHGPADRSRVHRIPLDPDRRGRAAQDVRHPLGLLADDEHRHHCRCSRPAAVILWAPDSELTYDTFAAAIGFPMSVILPMVAILSVTSEWTQRSGLTTFTLVPHRGRVIAAKAVATVDRRRRLDARRHGDRRARQHRRHGDHRHRHASGTPRSPDLAMIVAGQRARHAGRLHARRGDPQLGRRDRRLLRVTRCVLPTLFGLLAASCQGGSATCRPGSTSTSPRARCSTASMAGEQWAQLGHVQRDLAGRPAGRRAAAADALRGQVGGAQFHWVPSGNCRCPACCNIGTAAGSPAQYAGTWSRLIRARQGWSCVRCSSQSLPVSISA